MERWVSKLRDFGLIACAYFPYRPKKRVITPLVALKQLAAFVAGRSQPASSPADSRNDTPEVPRKNEDESPAKMRSDSRAPDDSVNLDKNRTTLVPAYDALPVPSLPLVENVVASSLCDFPVEPQMKSALTATPPTLNAQRSTSQQSAVVQQLEAQGVDAPVARRLAKQDAEECLRQLEALPSYPCDQSLPGLLVSAITRRFRRNKPATRPDYPATPKRSHQSSQTAPVPSPEALVEIELDARSAIALARAHSKSVAGRWREYA